MASAVDAAGDPIPNSAVLTAAAKHIQFRCQEENVAFLKCKKKDSNPEKCLDQGRQVTRCVLSLIYGVDGKTLQAALDWACGLGRANCTEIQPEENCYSPNNVKNYASYAFDSYYQKQGKAAGSCDFKGVATITTDPKPLWIWCDIVMKMPTLKRRVPVQLPGLVIMCLIPSGFLIFVMAIATKTVCLVSAIMSVAGVGWFFLMKYCKSKKLFKFSANEVEDVVEE